MRLLSLIIISLFFLAGCNMENNSRCTQKVTVVDKTGLDGCGLMFQISENERLEPVEWAVEEPELIPGNTYYIDYEAVEMASICMAGKTVRITCIMEAQ